MASDQNIKGLVERLRTRAQKLLKGPVAAIPTYRVEDANTDTEAANALERTHARAEAAEARLENREARRMEILDWLQEHIGTAWDCTNCGYSTYHCYGQNCADCDEPFPLLDALAFKIHATGTENDDYIRAARSALASPHPTPASPCPHCDALAEGLRRCASTATAPSLTKIGLRNALDAVQQTARAALAQHRKGDGDAQEGSET